MKLYGALILMLTVSTVSGLTCFSCTAASPGSCTGTTTCPNALNRCFSLDVAGSVTKGCIHNVGCVGPMTCCEGNLCNTAVPSGPSVILLLVSSAIITLFL